MMKQICIASNNPVKIQAALEGFTRMFPDEVFEVHPVATSVVLPAQPSSDEETLLCAELRAQNAHSLAPKATFWVGIEGGIADGPQGMGAFAWVVILDDQRSGCGRTGEFLLPEAVASLVRQGMELGEADDRVFSRNNSKHGEGAVGLLTGSAIDRTGLYIPAVIFALIPFKNPALY